MTLAQAPDNFGPLSTDTPADSAPIDQPVRPGRRQPCRYRPRLPGRRPRRPYRALSDIGQWHARAHAARPGPGRFVRAELAAVRLPAGWRPVVDAGAAAQLVDELPDITAGLREDSRRTRRAVWHALVEHLAPESGLVIAGHAQLAARAGEHLGRPVARSTVGYHVRALVAAGVLWVAQHGASAAALGADRNRAPSYVISAPEPPQRLSEQDQQAIERLAERLAGAGRPAVDELWHLPEGSARSRVRRDISTPESARFSRLPSSAGGDPGHGRSQHPRMARDSVRFDRSQDRLGLRDNERSVKRSSTLDRPVTTVDRSTSVRSEQPWRYVPRTASDRVTAAAWLAASTGLALRAHRLEELAQVGAPFFAAGWSPAGVARAFVMRPDGRPWPGPLPTPDQRDSADPPRVRRLFAVLVWRLAHWRDDAGVPLDPPVEAERPRRGRPPRPRASSSAPAAPRPAARPAEVEAQLREWRARDDQRRAARAAAAAARERRRAVEWLPGERGNNC